MDRRLWLISMWKRVIATSQCPPASTLELTDGQRCPILSHDIESLSHDIESLSHDNKPFPLGFDSFPYRFNGETIGFRPSTIAFALKTSHLKALRYCSAPDSGSSVLSWYDFMQTSIRKILGR